MLNGSAWSTEMKYMDRYKGTFDIFFGIEHRMKKEEMEEQFNKVVKQGWRFAADAAGLPTRTQVVKIASIRRVESLWQLTVIWDLWVTKTTEQLGPFWVRYALPLCVPVASHPTRCLSCHLFTSGLLNHSHLLIEVNRSALLPRFFREI